MSYYQNETKQNISNSYESFTPVDKSIANFLLSNTERMDFSSKNIAKRLYVSEAALSRFSKKCGYKGYRELIYSYEKDLELEIPVEQNELNVGAFTKKIRFSYSSLLNETCSMLDEKQIQRIAALLDEKKRIFVYGQGSSGLVAKEFQLRFMRIGVPAEAITDAQMIQMNAALAEPDQLIIGISLSGCTEEVNNGVRLARKKGARVVYITANAQTPVRPFCDELVVTAYMKNLDTGTKISPQFLPLIILDVLYSYYFANDTYGKVKKYRQTLAAIRGENSDEMD